MGEPAESRLGLDFGGVIVPMLSRDGGPDTQFAERFERTLPHPGAIERITDLVEILNGRVWIVSKAGRRTEELSRRWFEVTSFFERTGLASDHVRFCRARPDKAPICEGLGITHFVDDRIHIMQILRGVVPNLYLFGDRADNRSARSWATLVEDWDELFETIRRDL